MSNGCGRIARQRGPVIHSVGLHSPWQVLVKKSPNSKFRNSAVFLFEYFLSERCLGIRCLAFPAYPADRTKDTLT